MIKDSMQRLQSNSFEKWKMRMKAHGNAVILTSITKRLMRLQTKYNIESDTMAFVHIEELEQMTWFVFKEKCFVIFSIKNN